MKVQTPTLLAQGLADEQARKPLIRALAMFAAWWVLLLAFHLFPGVDLSASRAFFMAQACPEPQAAGFLCGDFGYSAIETLKRLRKVLFYIPSFAALVLLWLLIKGLQQHGATYDARRTRQYSLALLAFVLGPYVLVNLGLKSFSGRPRPYETDLFGGDLPFASAGSFTGQCQNNCSFVSGEAAGAGWLICLIPLVPRRLKPFLVPPIVAVSLMTPVLRVSFGGHYLSDVTLGWLSSIVIYFAVFAAAELLALRKKLRSGTKI